MTDFERLEAKIDKLTDKIHDLDVALAVHKARAGLLGALAGALVSFLTNAGTVLASVKTIITKLF